MHIIFLSITPNGYQMSITRYFKLILILCLLGSNFSFAESKYTYIQQISGELRDELRDENEDESSAIVFQNTAEVQFEQVPDQVHHTVHDRLQGQTDTDFSYAKILDGEYKDHYVVSVTKKNSNGKRENLEYLVISADGILKKSDTKIRAFTAKKYYFVERLAHHIESLAHPSSVKDSSFSGIRERYNKELTDMAAQISDIGLENIDAARAKEFYQKRRELGMELKNESGFVAKIGIYARNLWNYGDTLGPTYESFAKKGLTPAQIAVKAVTSGGADLGLKSNSKEPIIARLNKELQKKPLGAPPARPTIPKQAPHQAPGVQMPMAQKPSAKQKQNTTLSDKRSDNALPKGFKRFRESSNNPNLNRSMKRGASTMTKTQPQDLVDTVQ